MKALAAALSLLVLSSPAFAQDGPGPAAGRATDATPANTSQSDNGAPSERRICREHGGRFDLAHGRAPRLPDRDRMARSRAADSRLIA